MSKLSLDLFADKGQEEHIQEPKDFEEKLGIDSLNVSSLDNVVIDNTNINNIVEELQSTHIPLCNTENQNFL